jgi:Raf kinase inhibitor-like YbhB/YbcL family protein
MKISFKNFFQYCYTVVLISAMLVVPSYGVREDSTMKLFSTAFADQKTIPVKYTAQGESTSPPLRWQDVPSGTRSLALICEDPDAVIGTYDHWLLYNIPASVGVLAEGIKVLPPGTQSLLTSAGTKGYTPPNPPSGTHRYFFILYALDTVLQLPESATKADLLKAMNGHILAEATLVGRYKR